MKRRKLFEIVNEVIGENKYTSTKNLYWNELLSRYKLPEWFIEKYRLKFDTNLLYNYQLLSIEYINKYFMYDRIHFTTIIKNQKLSEDFIEKYKNYLEWDHISYYQLLSEEFIEKYRHELDWFSVLLNQPFIDKEKLKSIKDLSVNLTLLDKNYLYQQYKKGKDWFIGYTFDPEINNKIKKVFMDEITIYRSGITDQAIKIKIYWDDLITTHSAKEIYPIRKVKLI